MGLGHWEEPFVKLVDTPRVTSGIKDDFLV
jgi:hypothetical protein